MDICFANREGFEFYVGFEGLHFHKCRLGQCPTRVLRWFTPPRGRRDPLYQHRQRRHSEPSAISARGRDPLHKKGIDERGSNAATEHDSLAPIIEITIDGAQGQWVEI